MECECKYRNGDLHILISMLMHMSYIFYLLSGELNVRHVVRLLSACFLYVFDIKSTWFTLVQ